MGRVILHDGTCWSRTDLFFWGGGGISGEPQIRILGPNFWAFDCEYLENGKSQRYVSIRAHQL